MRKFIGVSRKLLIGVVLIILAVLFPGYSLKSALFLALGLGTSLSLWRLSLTQDSYFIYPHSKKKGQII